MKKLRCIHVAVIAFLLTTLAAAKGKPNILFIAIDDMNDWIGPLGGLGDLPKTPNLDRLAGQSVTFTNAHCASPACSPSRLSIMSGVQPSRSGKMRIEWYDGPGWRKDTIFRDIETIEQFYKNRGYETLAGGKIYHTLAPPWITLNHADPEGWDFCFPSVYGPIPFQVRAPEEVIRPVDFKGDRHPWFTWGPVNVDDKKMADYQVVDWARYELGRKHEKPLYLACGIFRPHMPWEVPQKYFDLYPLEEILDLVIDENDLEDAYDHGRRQWQKFVLENNQWKKVIQAYLASISFSDAMLGRLLDGLDQSEYADNTIVVLWADHGMHIGEKENWEKFTLWEESTRVPLIIRPVGFNNPGETCAEPASLLDIYPTLAELVGFKAPDQCDGISLVAQLNDQDKERKINALTSVNFDGKDRIGHALRSHDFRYIFYKDNKLEELYDHRSDPHEFINLAYDPRYRKVVKEFRREMVERVDRISMEMMEQDPVGYDIVNSKPVSSAYLPLSKIELITVKEK